MCRHRWSALTPPTDRGLRIQAPMPIVAEKDLILELSAVTAFASGLLLQLAMKVTGIRADFARYETRPLTDPHDWSARWSYLTVLVSADELDGPADPIHSSEPPTGESGLYRTTPWYWIGAYPRTGSLTVTTSWTEIGLRPASIVVALGPSPFTTASESGAGR
ncbi:MULTISPECIES: hypothetical protein [Rhodococcus]|uniref:Uncharacterized protein n=1 Tax=Rhodococcus oxybenzonivorans TaxID=1990687 RepID=A0AAE5A954_9NOCA|nr:MULTISPECIES: hypothetical protein [Rhodococcus]MDV7243526.1 hypothetical protein [Rhodococcus oxybenzonivorans]MDV7268146.1 hypothetical protein [Rhodococcus oxybenzonivorans]MDV7277502.1 hypothetical protein [Rhodococcus oxybenzonivorans]MDV7335470.1 hypothetical protein [Rhodococcus oxybenzonivorans]MDV7347214.1 hypothetical protein [Rhodococcus oxybenzonivorans]